MSDEREDLVVYTAELRGELEIEAAEEGLERTLAEAFTERVLEVIVEAGEVEEAMAAYHASRGIEVSGYGVEDEDVLNLFVTAYRGSVPPETFGKRDIEAAFKRLWTFWERCSGRPYFEELEESSDAWDMARRLHEVGSAGQIKRIQMFLLTDGITKAEYLEPEMDDDLEIRRAIWDIRRLKRFEASGQPGEPIEVDFVEEFGEPLRCLCAPDTGDGYAAYFAVLPGEQLARIYDRYGPRLLELNVRSFLQARGKVNKGIRQTLIEDPQRFLAYNNGISATATAIDLVKTDSGPAIRSLKELQIVNGGQTTASVHRAFRSDVPLDRVQVQTKITAADSETLNALVPLVSRYANSQNKVSEADLRANDPFQVQIETLSRSIWAPATADTKQQSHWFYERARGQYADALNRESTPAKRKKFRATNPTRQKITKTDLAKFEATWQQRPFDVSRGAQKNFIAFMMDREARKLPVPEEEYFRRTVAKAILFKTTERIVSAQEFGGYRANIVTYTIAKLVRLSEQKLGLDRIWTEQAVDEDLQDVIAKLSHKVFAVLTAESRPTANVTEWAKREQCWKQVIAIYHEVPDSVRVGFIALARDGADGAANSDGASGAAVEDPLVAEIAATAPEYWFGLANWAKETRNLQPWQRGIAFSIGRLLGSDRLPSHKQAKQARLMMDEARKLGFAMDPHLAGASDQVGR